MVLRAGEQEMLEKMREFVNDRRGKTQENWEKAAAKIAEGQPHQAEAAGRWTGMLKREV